MDESTNILRHPGAAGRVVRLLRAELAKTRGRVAPALVPAAAGAAALLGALGYRFVAPLEDPMALQNGWGATASAARLGLPAGAFLLLVLGSQLVAADASSGALRSVLCLPVRRGEVFAAKALAAFAWAVAVFAAVWGVSLACGAAFGGFGDVTETLRYGGETAVIRHQGADRMAGILGAVLPLSLPPLAAAAFLGLACSTLAVRPAPALVAALAVYLPLEVFVEPLSGSLSPYLFTTYTDGLPAILADFARGLSTARFPSRAPLLSLLSSGGAAILFLAGSFNVFRRRDVSE